MRIITGSLKGRTIQTVSSHETRPTSDKVKEAVFHVLGPYFKGGQALDLYAGSGSLGIEAISRGMDLAIMVDRLPKAIQTIRKNVRQLQIENQVEIYRNTALRALHILAKKSRTFDLIFIDPPYESKDYTQVLEQIQRSNLANKNGYIYLEHTPKKTFLFDKTYYHIVFEREYSKEIAVTILQVR